MNLSACDESIRDQSIIRNVFLPKYPASFIKAECQRVVSSAHRYSFQPGVFDEIPPQFVILFS